VTDAVEAPDEEPSNNPDSAWLHEQAKLAWDMGIREVEDVRDLLNNMSTEEARANLADLRACDELTQLVFGVSGPGVRL
jgi:hypothetical protein